jgi:dTDP-4-dehydrorhamnose reductase
MKWLITGANGQLGRCLQKTLDSHGIDFVALSRSELDITNISLIKESFRSINPDVVFNTAAYTNVEQAEVDSAAAYAINQSGAKNVAKASESVGAKLVHFSTDYVYGSKRAYYKETDHCQPLNYYGKTKYLGDRSIINANIKFLIFRIKILFLLSTRKKR